MAVREVGVSVPVSREIKCSDQWIRSEQPAGHSKVQWAWPRPNGHTQRLTYKTDGIICL